jgi:DNA-binding NarL/FixJ family response regulator
MALGRRWDLVILDLALNGRSGLEALKAIKAQRPDLPVLMLGWQPEHQYATRAFRAGAAGYLADSSAPVELVRAVRKTLEGDHYVSEALAEQWAAGLGTPRQGLPHEALSDRELQVLLLIGAGRTVKEAAVELSLSENTVSTYRARILDKMGLETSAELVRYVWENRLLP